MSQPPIMTIRDRKLSASIFEREKDGKKFYGICVQRSFKRDKNSDKWEREQINLFSDDLLKLSLLLQTTYNRLIEYAQQNKAPTTTAADYQAAKDGWDAGQQGFDDDIPF